MTALPDRLAVLLVDDDDNDVFLTRRALKRLGTIARVDVVPDGDAAISYLRGTGRSQNRGAPPLPDVVLLDQFLPRLSGLDVLCWIRTEPRLASLPVVLLSGGLTPAQQTQASDLRAASCPKGGGAAELMDAIVRASAAALGFEGRNGRANARPNNASFHSAFDPIRLWT